MKKILLSAAFSVFAYAAAFAQTSSFPCISPDVKIEANNGGGLCSNVDGYVKSGTITITFDYPPSEAPAIVSIIDNETNVVIPDVLFVFNSFGFFQGQVTATYCYYGLDRKIHLNNGQNDYRFVLSYSGRVGVGCDPEPIILPVKLHSFTAARKSEKVDLTWVTASEDNNRGFELQRMLGTGKWSTVAFIFSQADGGNSTSNLTYQFRDDNNYSGISQYRLLQIDLDGKVKYSDIRSVRGQAQANKTLVFPNPGFNGTVNVIFEDGSANRSLALTDMSGRMIRQWNNFTDNSLQVSNLKPGMYNLRIYNTETGVQSVEKIIIANRSTN